MEEAREASDGAGDGGGGGEEGLLLRSGVGGVGMGGAVEDEGRGGRGGVEVVVEVVVVVVVEVVVVGVGVRVGVGVGVVEEVGMGDCLRGRNLVFRFLELRFRWGVLEIDVRSVAMSISPDPVGADGSGKGGEAEAVVEDLDDLD